MPLHTIHHGSKALVLLVTFSMTVTAIFANGRDTTITKPPAPPATADSAAVAKAELARYLVHRNFDSAMLLARQVLSYSESKHFEYGIGTAGNAIGWAYLSKGRYDSCTKYLLMAKAAFIAAHAPQDAVKMEMNLAEAYTRQSFYALAINSLLKSETDAKKLGNEDILNDVNRQLGIIYREMGDQQKSIAYLKKGMAGFARMNDNFRYINTALSLAIEYNYMDLYDSALATLNLVLPLAQAADRNEYQTAMILEHFGNSWNGKKRPELANFYFLRAYDNFRKLGNTADIAYEGINIGSTYVKLKKYDLAEKYYRTSMQMLDSLSITNYKLDLIRSMSEMYVAKGDWQKAYDYLKRSVTLNDSVVAAANLTQAKEIKERYETEKKEREISLLKKSNEVNLLRLQKQRAWEYAAIVIVILLTLMAFLAVNRYRVVQRSKRLVEIEKMRRDIASDLHDDIGSTLSSLNIQSRVLSSQIDGLPVVKQNLEKIHDHTLEMMDSMSDIVWAIDPKQDKVESVIFRMKEFAGEVLEPLGIVYAFDEHGDFSGQLNPRQRKNLYLIFKEVINNAAKYSNCSEVNVDLKSEGDWITLSVTDNGIGFDERLLSSGNGLKNIRARAKELNGGLTVDSAPGRGTTVRLDMPYHDLGMRYADLSSMLPAK